jgi:hypothetical protein
MRKGISSDGVNAKISKQVIREATGAVFEQTSHCLNNSL